jgi:hypothetical protein
VLATFGAIEFTQEPGDALGVWVDFRFEAQPDVHLGIGGRIDDEPHAFNRLSAVCIQKRHEQMRSALQSDEFVQTSAC